MWAGGRAFDLSGAASLRFLQRADLDGASFILAPATLTSLVVPACPCVHDRPSGRHHIIRLRRAEPWQLCNDLTYPKSSEIVL